MDLLCLPGLLVLPLLFPHKKSGCKLGVYCALGGRLKFVDCRLVDLCGFAQRCFVDAGPDADDVWLVCRPLSLEAPLDLVVDILHEGRRRGAFAPRAIPLSSLLETRTQQHLLFAWQRADFEPLGVLDEWGYHLPVAATFLKPIETFIAA